MRMHTFDPQPQVLQPGGELGRKADEIVTVGLELETDSNIDVDEAVVALSFQEGIVHLCRAKVERGSASGSNHHVGAIEEGRIARTQRSLVNSRRVCPSLREVPR
eukprot:2478452-Rhodomonas_salina.2